MAQLVHDLLDLQLLVGVAQHLERGGRVRVAALVRMHLGAQRGVGSAAAMECVNTYVFVKARNESTLSLVLETAHFKQARSCRQVRVSAELQAALSRYSIYRAITAPAKPPPVAQGDRTSRLALRYWRFASSSVASKRRPSCSNGLSLNAPRIRFTSFARSTSRTSAKKPCADAPDTCCFPCLSGLHRPRH